MTAENPRGALPNIAASELGFKIQDSFVIGDKECDVDMGRRLGATTFLVLTGYGKKTDADQTARPDYVVADLEQAAIMIDRLLQENAFSKF